MPGSRTQKRAEYVAATDEEALAMPFIALCRIEGIIPALESSHALALCPEASRLKMTSDQIILVNLSGRGDKDLHIVGEQGVPEHVLLAPPGGAQ